MTTQSKCILASIRSHFSFFLALAFFFFIGCGASQCPVCPTPTSATNPDPIKVETAVVSQASGEGHSDRDDLPVLDEASALERLLTKKTANPDWFGDKFLEEVPVSAIQKIVSEVKNELGEFLSVTKVSDKYEVKFEKGVMPCNVSLDDKGRFSGLWLHPPILDTATFDEAEKMFRVLEGKRSVLVLDGDGNELFSEFPDKPLETNDLAGPYRTLLAATRAVLKR